MIKSLLKDWAKRILSADESAQRELQSESIKIGSSLEERANFWFKLDEMFRSEAGKAYQALMQREFGRIQSQLMDEKTSKERQAELLVQMRQQAYVLDYPDVVKKKARELEQQLRDTLR